MITNVFLTDISSWKRMPIFPAHSINGIFTDVQGYPTSPKEEWIHSPSLQHGLALAPLSILKLQELLDHRLFF